MPQLSEGESLFGVYEVERFLGEGAFAEVYRVQHRFLGRQAMKVFKAPARSADEVRQHLREAMLLSRIGHPNVVRVFDASVIERANGLFGFLTMEYVAGGTLDRYWRSYAGQFMPIGEVVEVMRQVSAGIAVAHAESPPVIHRDIKPQNILVGYDGSGLRIRVSDFGLAKQADPLSLLVSARGTLSFKPPEAFNDMDSTAADVWALGTTMYLLLTDTVPYPDLDGRDLNDAHRFLGELRPARTFNVHVDDAMQQIVARCLERNARDRYPNAGELNAALARWRPTNRNVSGSSASASTFKAGAAASIPSDGTLESRLQEAMRMARVPGSLMMAADLLEQVLNDSPKLRDRYESQLRLWRRGVSM
ncbi:MAG: serine/threonine protein kinase [Phycisphaerales bacterium]|nr:serine/threonine protein kinase [Phycisphaerales bacterium]